MDKDDEADLEDDEDMPFAHPSTSSSIASPAQPSTSHLILCQPSKSKNGPSWRLRSTGSARSSAMHNGMLKQHRCMLQWRHSSVKN